MTENAFPIKPQPEDDPRFTAGLLSDMRDVLRKHGYPEIATGRDALDLQMALWRFLYEEKGR